MKTIFLSFSIIFTCFSNLFGQEKHPKLEFNHLTGNFYIYTTWQTYNNYDVPANSMYLVTNQGIVLFDTPWDSTQFQPFLDSLESRHQQKAIMSISTHSHGDRTAGVEYFKTKGIKTYASKQTYDLCIKNEEKVPEFYFVNDTTFNIGGYTIQTFYPGTGHTIDNIVIWIESDKILYGGCFIKSPEVDDLGYITEANLEEWKVSVKKVKHKFVQPKFVIPGHYDWTNKKGLKHTLFLLKKEKKKKTEELL